MHSPADHLERRRRRAADAIVFTAIVAVCAITMVVMVTGFNRGPSAEVAAHGWSAEAILCGDLSRTAIGAVGDVVALDAAATEDVVRESCNTATSSGRGGPAPVLAAGHSYFWYDTGVDRFDVRLVRIEADADPPLLDVELDTPAGECGITAEYRGRLVLLIKAPPGSPPPRIELREVASCR